MPFHGLDNDKPPDDQDWNATLVEAAKQAQYTAVTDLLRIRDNYSISILINALVATSNESLMLDILELVAAATARDDNNMPDWPPFLLPRAAALGFNKFVEELLKFEISLPKQSNGLFESFFRALGLAVALQHRETTSILLEQPAGIQRLKDSTGLVEDAAMHSRADLVEMLVMTAENHAATESRLDGALYYACVGGNYGATKTLLKLGADPDMSVTIVGGTYPPLYVAIMMRHRKTTRVLLDQHANPDIECPSDEETPLAYAARLGFEEICHLLLSYGANPNHHFIRRPILSTVIVDSIKRSEDQKIDMIKLLIEKNALVDASDGNGSTALLLALIRGEDKLVKQLLESGADAQIQNRFGWCPLIYAVNKGTAGILKLLLQRHPLMLLDRTSFGAKALCSVQDDVEITRILLEEKADPNLTTSDIGETSLMAAAARGRTEVVKLLLEYNADPNIEIDRNYKIEGSTAVTLAAGYNHADVIRVLADAGANLKHRVGKDGNCPLHLAAGPDSLTALLEYRKRVDINQVNWNGETPLSRVMKKHEIPVKDVRLLIVAGADLNVQDTTGRTVLYDAVAANNEEVASIFLDESDIDINLASPYSGGPLHLACAKGYFNLVKLQVEKGADVNYIVPGAPGTPLQSACGSFYSGKWDDPLVNRKIIVDYLISKGADVKKKGGLSGNLTNSAAWNGTPETISLVLRRGAPVDVCDAMGRFPIHFAALNGIDNFRAIVQATDGGRVLVRDKLQRTTLHWAAQYRHVEVIEYIILWELGTGSINDPDIDG